ncbi:hypothetical protein DRN67_03235 [Candidatus Micrarchaeota archaeon]|nr:MAG: hypothetical protein DRN67_03235 [Candidatus Micrarchaeota archaeon]
MKRAQIFSSDFIFSVVLFTIVLLILFPIWNNITYQTQEAEARKEMQISTIAIADLLTRSTGSPADWNASTVKSIGLANSAHELNTTKFLRLKQIEHEDAKDLLGIPTYNISINITQRNGYLATSGIARSPVAYYSASTHEMQPLLSNSGIEWDYYWGHNLPDAEPDHGDSRNFYDGVEVDTMNALLFNATANNAYKTIVIEQPGLTPPQINETALIDFVENGGRLIFEGEGFGGYMLIENLGMSYHTGADADGVVNKSDWFFHASTGLPVLFGSSSYSFYSDEGDVPITIEVPDSSNFSRGLIANWRFGNGRVYYLADINGTVGGDALSNHFRIGGEQLDYGYYPTNESIDIFISKRAAVLLTDGEDGRRMVSMNLVIWR